MKPIYSFIQNKLQEIKFDMVSLNELSLRGKILFIVIYAILFFPLMAFYALTWLLEPFQPEHFVEVENNSTIKQP